MSSGVPRALLTVAAFVGLLGTAGSAAPRSPEASAAGIRAWQFSTTVAASINAHLSSRSVPELGALSRREQDQLLSFYAPDARAVWTDPAGVPNANAHEVLSLLEQAADEGLNSQEYGMPRLRLLAQDLQQALPTPSPDAIARFDVALSAAALRYFGDLHFGRVDPKALGLRVQAPADRHDMTAVLHSAIAAGRIREAAAELVPPLVQYRGLRNALARYRVIAGDTTIPPAPVFSGTIRPGDTAPAPRLRALARRLSALGDLDKDAAALEPIVYSEALVEGVKRFQARHGLEPDGVIGRATQAALSVPLTWRVRQIELALERLRWLPDLRDTRVLALNIPMFRLWAWDETRPDGRPALGMAAIVGRALRTETPVFVEELRQVIFRPYWNVPRSILRSEILPLIAKDAEYLRREEMEIVQGPGDDARPLPLNDETMARLEQGALRLRQRPGSRNALGLVKFEFPNDQNVYLHGTPAQELFARTRRDFSHGCVRVADPASLAEWVLQGQAEWTRERILGAMTARGPARVAVARPVQVVLFYLTAAVVPEDGAIHFAEDLYRHDAPLNRALAAGRR